MKNAEYIARKFPSPLRYPGGKSGLSKFLSKVLETNGINGNYCEGYAGGAGAALNLLLKDKIERVILNDADIHIYSFWSSILKDADRFIERLINCPITISEWNIQKSIYENPLKNSEFDVGFSTFFLNRTNRGGILPKAGPTGGLSQDGHYKINARFKKENLIPRIEKIFTLRNRISFYNYDAVEFLDMIQSDFDISNTLIYLDPPYYEQGKNLYLNYYYDRDHSELSSKLKKSFTDNWLVSYDNVAHIRQLYPKHRYCAFDINYSVQTTRKGKEIMFFSHNLKLPLKLEIGSQSYNLNLDLCPTK